MALFRPQRPLRLLSVPRAPAVRTYAASTRPSTAPKPVRKVVVPKPNSGKAAQPPTTPAASTKASQPLFAKSTPVAPKAAPKQAQKPPAPAPKPLDPNSPEYKKKYNDLSRRVLASLIAVPVFLVTSYYLFDRLILGNEKKDFSKDGPPKDERDPLAKTI